MRLTDYEKKVRREIDHWQNANGSLLHQAMNWSMAPVDWVVERVVPETIQDQVSEGISDFLSMLNDATEWTFDENEVLEMARLNDIEIGSLADLRDQPLEKLDDMTRDAFGENAIVAAIEGAGFGLGGAALIAADIPVLFTINLRLIQQIGGAYGFPMRGPQFRPIVLHIFNAAASGSQPAKFEAMKEISVAGAAFAAGMDYRGRAAGSTFREQNRHLPREIGKRLFGRKLGQLIPVAGAAVGAGVNYWFTSETADTALMLFRYLYLERKERL